MFNLMILPAGMMAKFLLLETGYKNDSYNLLPPDVTSATLTVMVATDILVEKVHPKSP